MNKLTRPSTSSYFTVESQILQVRLVMLETKGLEIFGHGLCLLTEREECSDFNFCPAILGLENEILKKYYYKVGL